MILTRFSSRLTKFCTKNATNIASRRELSELSLEPKWEAILFAWLREFNRSMDWPCFKTEHFFWKDKIVASLCQGLCERVLYLLPQCVVYFCAVQLVQEQSDMVHRAVPPIRL